MLGGFRSFLNKSPWAGWALAGVLLCVAVFFYIRSRSAGADPYSPARMQEMVTIHYTDTDEEETIPRGRLDKELRQQGDHLDPSKGIINKKTGKPTGFLIAKQDWDEMIARINTEKEEAKKHPGGGVFSPAPAAGKK